MATAGSVAGTTTLSTHPNLLSTHRALISTLASFLTVTTHQILYLRRIYPPASFLTTCAYNYPVHQNRHPAVIGWINDAIASITTELSKNTISLLSLCIHELETNAVLERWSFDLHTLPSVDKRDRDVPFTSPANPNELLPQQSDADQPLALKINLTDLEATFRATLSRLSSTSARLSPLPSGLGAPELTFTLTIELRPDADRPVGRLNASERRWIVAEDEPPTTMAAPEPPSATSDQPPPNQGKTHPIRRLDAAPLHIELWVEESAQKLKSSTVASASVSNTSVGSTTRSAATRAAETSFGAGAEKYFDPNVGYEDDLEGTDLNRKPDGGAMTEYRRM